MRWCPHQGNHKGAAETLDSGGCRVELLVSRAEGPRSRVAVGSSLRNSFLWLGTLWLMASESGPPGHFASSLIVLIKLLFSLK